MTDVLSGMTAWGHARGPRRPPYFRRGSSTPTWVPGAFSPPAVGRAIPGRLGCRRMEDQFPISEAHSASDPAIVSFTIDSLWPGMFNWTCEAHGMDAANGAAGGMIGSWAED